jgi:hypothetical protein
MDTRCYKLTILIVLYNKEVEDSTTFNSIDSALQYLNTSKNEIKICFWNNGPKEIKSDIKTNNYTFDFIQTVDNRSLSYIYNIFLNNNDSERYIILDHDSELSKDYIHECLNDNVDCMVPTIMTSNNIESPKVYPQRSFYGPNTVLAIGSGICISKSLRDKYKQQFSEVFDQRFYFYGVDSTFFLRLNKLNLAQALKTSKSVVLHSLSRCEDEGEEIKEFRIKERSYDQALTLRYYFCKFTAIIAFKKMLGALFFNKSDIKMKYFIPAFVSGKHYKSNKK